MAEQMQTPIPQNVWRNLHPGSGIQDMNKRIWTVTAGDPRSADCLFAHCNGNGEKRLFWRNGQILDVFGVVVPELNHPSVTIAYVINNKS